MLTRHHVLSTNTKSRLARNIIFFGFGGVIYAGSKKPHGKNIIIHFMIRFAEKSARQNFIVRNLSYFPIVLTRIYLQIMNGSKRGRVVCVDVPATTDARTCTHARTHARSSNVVFLSFLLCCICSVTWKGKKGKVKKLWLFFLFFLPRAVFGWAVCPALVGLGCFFFRLCVVRRASLVSFSSGLWEAKKVWTMCTMWENTLSRNRLERINGWGCGPSPSSRHIIWNSFSSSFLLTYGEILPFIDFYFFSRERDKGGKVGGWINGFEYR